MKPQNLIHETIMIHKMLDKRTISMEGVRTSAEERQIPMEISYGDPDNPWDDEPQGRQIQKYRRPTTAFQERILRTVYMKYFPDDTYKYKGDRFKSIYIMIEKAMLPLSSSLVAVYPTEWIEAAIIWVREKGLRGKKALKALTTFILNNDRMQDFIADWQKKNLSEDKLPGVDQFGYES